VPPTRRSTTVERRIFPKFAPIDTVTSLTINGTERTEGEDFFVYGTNFVFGSAPGCRGKSIELVYKADDIAPCDSPPHLEPL
jgi:hypothetical protein